MVKSNQPRNFLVPFEDARTVVEHPEWLEKLKNAKTPEEERKEIKLKK